MVKDRQEASLIDNGLTGRWNAQVVKSVGSAEHNWSEKTETTNKQAALTDDQTKKLFEEYMRSLEVK